MKLNPEEFDKIKSGQKKIEIRLLDIKRKALRIGDHITFSKRPALGEKITVQVTELLPFKTFAELVNHVPMTDFGYPQDFDKQKFIELIYTIYTKKEEKHFGVLGIRVDLGKLDHNSPI